MDTTELGRAVNSPSLQGSRPRVDAIIAALPPDLRAEVDQADALAEQARAAIPAHPGQPVDVVRAVQRRIVEAYLSGEDVDVDAVSGDAVAEYDAAAVAHFAARAAADELASLAVGAVYAVVMDAHDYWTRRVQEIQGEYATLVDDGLIADELAARREGPKATKAWETAQRLFDEYDRIRAGWRQARMLVDGKVDQHALDPSASFQVLGSTWRHDEVFATAAHPLDAAHRVGLVAWCPTRSQQVAWLEAEVQRRKAA